MTNEELNRLSAELIDLCRAHSGMYAELVPTIADKLRALAVQAYEEAAREADDYGRGQTPPPDASCTDAKYIAMCIRTLKQEIEAVPTPV